MGFAAIVASNGGVETCFALSKAICSTAGVEMCWVFQGTNVAVLGACTLGGVMAEGKAFVALGVRAER